MTTPPRPAPLCQTQSFIYTQSTWHTFTTDSWVDAVRVELGMQAFDPTTPLSHRTYGVRVYQGSPTGTLTEILTCTTLQHTNWWARPFVDFHCQLANGTDYIIQIFYHKDVQFNARLHLYEVGSGDVTGYNPLALPAGHQLGVLPTNPTGVTVRRNNNFSCNSRLSLATAPCNTSAMPTGGVVHNGRTYDLSTWYTFEVPAGNNVRIQAISSCLSPLVRLYYHPTQYLTDCSTPNVVLNRTFLGDLTINCMQAGRYTMQVLGRHVPTAPPSGRLGGRRRSPR